jgi:hypothetical protein
LASSTARNFFLTLAPGANVLHPFVGRLLVGVDGVVDFVVLQDGAEAERHRLSSTLKKRFFLVADAAAK